MFVSNTVILLYLTFKEKIMVQQKPYEGSLKWAIYGMSVATWMFILASGYVITRIIDGNWSSWQLPAILGIFWIVPVIIAAMYTSIGDVKYGIEYEMNQSKEKAAKAKVKEEVKTK